MSIFFGTVLARNERLFDKNGLTVHVLWTFMQLTKKNVRLTLGAILIALLAVVLVQNSGATTIRLIVWKLQMPLFLVVLLSALIGFGIGWLLKARRR